MYKCKNKLYVKVYKNILNNYYLKKKKKKVSPTFKKHF